MSVTLRSIDISGLERQAEVLAGYFVQVPVHVISDVRERGDWVVPENALDVGSGQCLDESVFQEGCEYGVIVGVGTGQLYAVGWASARLRYSTSLSQKPSQVPLAGDSSRWRTILRRF